MEEETSYSNCTRRASVRLTEDELDTIEGWLNSVISEFATCDEDFAEDKELMETMWGDFRS